MSSAREEPPSGFLILDKPQGWSSHRVVSRVRKWCQTRKVGHAGTLDPMATGVLVVGIGACTRLLTYAVGLPKTYSTTVRFGAATPTDDADSAPDSFADPAAINALNRAAIEQVLPRVRGSIAQVPSAVSAIKVGGVRAYARVRQGEDVQLKPRNVTISRCELQGDARHGMADVPDNSRIYPYADVDLIVAASSGTYVRAVARDLGEYLGVGAHLTALRRLDVGEFSLAQAQSVPDFDQDVPTPCLLSPVDAARALLPVLDVDEVHAARLRTGQRLSLAAPEAKLTEAVGLEPVTCAVASGSDLVAIGSYTSGHLRPLTVFPRV